MRGVQKVVTIFSHRTVIFDIDWYYIAQNKIKVTYILLKKKIKNGDSDKVKPFFCWHGNKPVGVCVTGHFVKCKLQTINSINK